MALAAEVVAERWTLLILREITFGSSRFNDIHRGVPRISPALLAQRLRKLVSVGIVEHPKNGCYELTEAGHALSPVLEGLAMWGRTWLPATLSQIRWDPDLIIWDMHRRLELSRMPDTQTIIQFVFTDQPKARRKRWIVCDRSDVAFCTSDPGIEPDLYITSDSRTITWVWYGDVTLAAALKNQSVKIDGPPELCAAFPSWIKLSKIAAVARRLPPDEKGPRPLVVKDRAKSRAVKRA